MSRRAIHVRLAMLASRAILAIVMAFAGGTGCDRAGTPSGASRAGPETTRRDAPAAPEFRARFVDITEASGIDFRHVTGGYGDKLLPETLGAGAALLDFDGDGVLDIFIVNSTYWPGHAPETEPAPTARLYRGKGDGSFEDVTEATGAGISLYGMGCAAADYDGDGDTDIYVTAVEDNALLRNDGGRFRDVTAEAGVAGGRWADANGASHPEWSTAACFADLDLDGDLDLFVTNYVQWTVEGEIFTTLDGRSKVFTTPDRYRGLPCRLFVNRGDGSFEDASTRAGLDGIDGKALGVALWDFDRDGRMDIVVANDTRPNFFFRNRPGNAVALLVERGVELGIAYDSSGRARAGMGIDIAEYARDGVPGVAIGNFSSEPMSLYRWRGETGFDSAEGAGGVAEATYRPLAFGVAFADIDLDGIEDLVVVNGHIEPDIARFRPDETHAQGAQIFQGLENGTFRDVSATSGDDLVKPRVGRGLAAGDIDGDGDLDLLITTNGGAPALLRNELRNVLRSGTKSTESPHFLRVRLEGRKPNTEAIGARLELRVTAEAAPQTRTARTGSSYLSQSEPTITFGLGKATKLHALEITWPDGERQSVDVREIEVDGTVRVRRE